MIMIEITSLSKNYGTQPALKSVSLRFTRGQSIALTGPNGSGKTTLLKSVLGLVLPDTGTILVNGHNTSHGYDYRQHLGYMPQISRFPEHLSVEGLFKMIKNIRKDKTGGYDTELYDKFGIREMEHKLLGSLSGGMRQKVSAALAFLFDPEILILDEPTAGLDPVSNDQLKKKISAGLQKGKLIITTSHNLGDLDEIANHVTYMMGGEVVLNGELWQLKEQAAEKTLSGMLIKLIHQQEQYV